MALTKDAYLFFQTFCVSCDKKDWKNIYLSLQWGEINTFQMRLSQPAWCAADWGRYGGAFQMLKIIKKKKKTRGSQKFVKKVPKNI